MEKKTKIILGVIAVAGISIYAYNKYSKKEPVKKDDSKKSTKVKTTAKNDGVENTSNVTSGGRMACVAPKPVWNGWTCVDKLKKAI